MLTDGKLAGMIAASFRSFAAIPSLASFGA
jgi:hypothetical protein